MATTGLVRGKTLPNSGNKNDLHELIDLSTVSISEIVDADVNNSAAISGSKINPNFGSQDVICDDVTCDDIQGDTIVLDEDTAPTTAADQGGVFVKNDGTQTELYFVEESDGDEVQITKSGLLNVLNSILDYETSGSSSTSKDNTDIKIAFGSVSVSSSTTITNLSFTSASSYYVALTGVETSGADAAVVTNNSGSQFTIYSPRGAMSWNWIAIGT